MTEALTVLDAPAVRRWFEHALRSLLAVRAQVDVLNVFPVPDGDTGTNLVRTLSGAAEAAGRLPVGASLTQLTATAARGALVNARGNSGVILSQAMRGLAHSVVALQQLDGTTLAGALTGAARGARQAVVRPVEGTILTVADAAAEAAQEAQDESLRTVVQAAVRAAVQALANTRSQLEVLTERDVVDAGAAGFVVLLGALEAVVDGGGTREHETTRQAREALAELWAEPRPAQAGGYCSLGSSVVGEAESASATGGGAFEVMYVLRASEHDAAELRARLDRVGDSVAVVGGVDDPVPVDHDRADDDAERAQDDDPRSDDVTRRPGTGRADLTADVGGADEHGLWRVHVHTDDPAAALADPAAMAQVCVSSLRGPTLAVVACTRVPGLAAPLAQTGAGVALYPDVAGLRRAVLDTGAPQVLVLPCDAASATAAAEAFAAPQPSGVPALIAARAPAHVLGSRHECAVLAVVSEQLAGDEHDHQRAAAEELVARVRGDDCGAAEAAETIDRLIRDDDEIVTVVIGAGLPPGSRERAEVLAHVAAAVAARAPSAELLVLDGGQRQPDLLLGAQ